MKVKMQANVKLADDEFVEECMNDLCTKYPEISGYVFERTGDHIQILMWGEGIEE